ncbi:hypothetical protein C5Y97_25400 [Blastopirellula marina]|uniref:Uncharacterized protein n=1 Tax=Blastopirellula marina TaxID=124 RepID=A0A2S8F8H1_9BACT|nr:hypothetical protein C5Y98_25385 [Blastopirellula marina]PTL41774.1 hypothetical protein C5Y97_25400 [Blastopirellula marina]
MNDVNPFESPQADTSAPPPSRGDAWIRVHRPAQYQDYLRAYWIKIDGQRREKIRVRETVTIPVESGEVLVGASIDWAMAQPMFVTVQPGETIDLELRGALRGWKILLASYYVFFRPGYWLELRRVGPLESSAAATSPQHDSLA